MPCSGASGRGARLGARILISALALSVAAGACTRPPREPVAGPTPAPTPTAHSTIRIATGSIVSLDPADLERPDELLVASQVFDGLVTHDPDTAAVLPATAGSWEILDGGRRFIFHLRPALFHDGNPARAQDFVFAWTRLADPEQPRPFAFLLEAVEGFEEYRETFGREGFSGVRALDAERLEVRLRFPWPDFVALLGHPALSPVPFYADRPDFDLRPVGSGPYRLVAEVQVGSPIRLTASPGAVTRAGVRLVEFRPFGSAQAAWPEFLSNEIDVSPIPADLLDEAQVEFGSRGVRPLAQTLYCGFNMADPRFERPTLRRAVSAALDREGLVREVYGPLADPAGGIVPPTIPGHRPRACPACRYRPDLAETLAAKLPPRARAFHLDYPRSSVGRRLARAVVEGLGEAGLRVRPRGQAAYIDLLQEGGQELLCLLWEATYPRQQAMLEPLLLSTSRDNLTKTSDRGLDELLKRARAETDPVRRQRTYQTAERRALHLLSVVPLAWFRSDLAARPGISGFAVDALGNIDASALRVTP